jgi:hypothetical protein
MAMSYENQLFAAKITACSIAALFAFDATIIPWVLGTRFRFFDALEILVLSHATAGTVFVTTWMATTPSN